MRTRTGDLVLIHQDNNPVAFARVDDIVADVKPGWWQVSLLLLHVPPKQVNWILRDAYVDGEEFTMGGRPMRLEPVPPPQPALPPEPEAPGPGDGPGEGKKGPGDGTDGKVVSLDRRRRDRS